MILIHLPETSRRRDESGVRAVEREDRGGGGEGGGDVGGFSPFFSFLILLSRTKLQGVFILWVGKY